MKDHINKNIYHTALFAVLLTFFFIPSVFSADNTEPLLPGYPTEIDSIDTISKITDNGIILGDQLYRLANTFMGHTKNGPVGIHSFEAGDQVGVIFQSKDVIESLWLLEKGSSISAKQQAAPEARGEKKKGTIILENGVWHN